MSNVTAMPGTKPASFAEPNQALIDALQDALDMAKEGRLQSMIGAGFTSDKCVMKIWSDYNEDVYQTMGSLQWLVSEYASKHTG